MKIYKNPSLDQKHCNGVIAIGNFDGLHLGHQKVISEAKRKAEKNEDYSVHREFPSILGKSHQLKKVRWGRQFAGLNSCFSHFLEVWWGGGG